MNALRAPRPEGYAEALRDLWQRRSLVFEFTRRDLKVRYRGTVLGVLWTLLHPVLHMAVWTLVFSVVVRADVARYPLFFLAGQLPWMFFSGAIATATRTLLEHGGVVRRAAFPREVFALAISFSGAFHLAVSLAVLLPLLLAFGVAPSWTWILVIPLLVLELVFVAGLSLLVSSATVYLRDLEQLVPVALNLWFVATPVFYPLVDDSGRSLVPEALRPLFVANPMTGFVSAFRDVLLNGRVPTLETLAVPTLAAVACLFGGYLVFRKLEPGLADRA